MVDLAGPRDDIAAKLTAAGLTVTVDPRDVTPPIVIVGLPRVVGPVGPCAYTVEVDISVVAPPPGNADAVNVLLDVAGVVLDTVGADRADPEPFVIAQRADGATTVPSYRITVTTNAT